MALGLAPAVFLPLVLLATHRSSVWPAVLAYHAYCWLAPRLSGGSRPIWGAGAWSQWLAPTAGFSALALLVAFYRPGWLMEEVRPRVATLLPLLKPWMAFVAYSLALNPLLEESFWRAFLLDRCGIWVSSTLFGLAHLAPLWVLLPWKWAVLLSLGPCVAGHAWAWTCRVSRSIWPCVVTHSAIDAAILWMLGSIRAA